MQFLLKIFLFFVFLLHTDFLFPCDIRLCNGSWQVLQLMLLKFTSNQFQLQLNWILHYLANTNNSIVFEDLCYIKASSDEGTEEVLECGESSSLDPTGSHLTQSSANQSTHYNLDGLFTLRKFTLIFLRQA